MSNVAMCVFVCLAKEGVIVDELCPMGQTISEQELRTKGKILN